MDARVLEVKLKAGVIEMKAVVGRCSGCGGKEKSRHEEVLAGSSEKLRVGVVSIEGRKGV